MPSSHTPFLTNHGGVQAAKKGIWKYGSILISHVRCPRLADCSKVFRWFSCGSREIMATEMLLVCGGDSNRSGQPEPRILENCRLLWNSVRDSTSFYSLVFLPQQLLFRSSCKNIIVFALVFWKNMLLLSPPLCLSEENLLTGWKGLCWQGWPACPPLCTMRVRAILKAGVGTCCIK